MGSSMKGDMDLGLNLLLTEEEYSRLELPSNTWTHTEVSKGNELVVVGRLLYHRNTNFDALSHTLSVVLEPMKGLTHWRILEERFCIRFNYKLDLRRVLDGRPWSFDKHLLIIEPLIANDNPIKVSLNWCPFTVLIHDLSLPQHSKIVAEFIGNKLGRFMDIDHHGHSFAWSSALEIRISFDLTKPLATFMCDHGVNSRIDFGSEKLDNLVSVISFLVLIDRLYYPWRPSFSASRGLIEIEHMSRQLRGQRIFGDLSIHVWKVASSVTILGKAQKIIDRVFDQCLPSSCNEKELVFPWHQILPRSIVRIFSKSSPIFEGEHYEYWSSQMQIFFESMGLWDVIDGELQPPGENDENFEKIAKRIQEERCDGTKTYSTRHRKISPFLEFLELNYRRSLGDFEALVSRYITDDCLEASITMMRF
ncbi:hypothetical protein Salat_0636400 [Sesamum alatum]|uniref:DUF4283 domain-containing protein n=1 Tax=Sesamum alatum TaxID=300844 RepID=A0AAE2CU68_9LAMI|nr:hypothetical protein Salat_0636400 [Sesamum alatum]